MSTVEDEEGAHAHPHLLNLTANVLMTVVADSSSQRDLLGTKTKWNVEVESSEVVADSKVQ